jgi:hypothetical protein
MMKRQKTDSLDRQLSYRLKKALGDDKRADWLDVCERAGMTRTAWRWSRRRVLLVAGVLVLAAGTSVAATGVIPWLNAEPKPTPPTVYPICKANVIEAKLDLQRVPSLRQGLSGTIILANTGEPTCALEGQPKVSLIDSGASAPELRVELSPEVESVFSPNPKKNPWSASQTLIGRVYEPVKQTSRIYIWWENWCGGDSGKPALRLEIANGSTLVLPASKLPGCVDPTKPSLLRIDAARSPQLPLGRSPSLRAEIVANEREPILLKSGEVFHYQVALTNMGASAFRFGDDCPVYYEGAHPGGDLNAFPSFGAGTYVLNCRSVKAIEPGKTVTFDMELAVSKDAWHGKGELIWVLAPGTKSPPTARSPIAVTGEPSSYSPSDVYSVFAPGTQEATFPPKVEKDSGFASSQWGPIVPGSRRIPMDRPGEADTVVYAFLTESGKACYVVVGVMASCDGGATQTSPIAWIAGGPDGGPRIIAGLARDGVKSVDVIVNGEPWPAKLENNAFYAEVLLDLGHEVSAIVATMDDGSQKRAEIGG